MDRTAAQRSPGSAGSLSPEVEAAGHSTEGLDQTTGNSNAAVYLIEGRQVHMPVVVRRARSATATYLVDAKRAAELLPDDRLVPAELLPGRALLSVACVDYQDNDLGDYNEVSIALFVRLRDQEPRTRYLATLAELLRGRLATYIWQLPVDQQFTCAAGRTIWGFPKSVEQIDLDVGGGRCRCRLVCQGRHVFTFTASAGGTRSLPPADMITYSYIDGRLHRTRFRSGATGVGFRLGGATIELGDHPIAERLRALGLPRRPVLSVWMGSMTGTFEAPEPIG